MHLVGGAIGILLGIGATVVLARVMQWNTLISPAGVVVVGCRPRGALLQRYGRRAGPRGSTPIRGLALRWRRPVNAADVLVLGAGIAGLAAAERLAAAGRFILVLEARDPLGGRIHTVDDPGLGVRWNSARSSSTDAPPS